MLTWLPTLSVRMRAYLRRQQSYDGCGWLGPPGEGAERGGGCCCFCDAGWDLRARYLGSIYSAEGVTFKVICGVVIAGPTVRTQRLSGLLALAANHAYPSQPAPASRTRNGAGSAPRLETTAVALARCQVRRRFASNSRALVATPVGRCHPRHTSWLWPRSWSAGDPFPTSLPASCVTSMMISRRPDRCELHCQHVWRVVACS